MCNIFRYDKHPVAPVFAKCAVRVYLGRFEDNEIMIENNIPVNCVVLRDLWGIKFTVEVGWLIVMFWVTRSV